jgi:hypothetical protein
MLNNKTLGVKIPELKAFYYIEAGDNWIGNSVDRIKKTLIQRNLIKADLNGTTTNYTICSYAKFKQEGLTYEVVPIFLSKHIEELYRANEPIKKTSGIFKS